MLGAAIFDQRDIREDAEGSVNNLAETANFKEEGRESGDNLEVAATTGEITKIGKS